MWFHLKLPKIKTAVDGKVGACKGNKPKLNSKWEVEMVESSMLNFFKPKWNGYTWDRFQQAKLLVERLNDQEIYRGESVYLLNSICPYETKPLDVCLRLMEAWHHIATKVESLKNAGYEINDEWQMRCNFAYTHMCDYIFSSLSNDDAVKFNEECRVIAIKMANKYCRDMVANPNLMTRAPSKRINSVRYTLEKMKAAIKIRNFEDKMVN